jgi:hypothetical protein
MNQKAISKENSKKKNLNNERGLGVYLLGIINSMHRVMFLIDRRPFYPTRSAIFGRHVSYSSKGLPISPRSLNQDLIKIRGRMMSHDKGAWW